MRYREERLAAAHRMRDPMPKVRAVPRSPAAIRMIAVASRKDVHPPCVALHKARRLRHFDARAHEMGAAVGRSGGPMNSAAALATAVMATLATCTAIAQEPTNHSKDAHFGIGAGFNLAPLTIVGSSYFASSPFGGGSLVVPIDILGAVRLEPEFGFMRISSTTEDASSRREDKATVVRPALGAFFMFPLGMNVGGTLGGRVGPQFVSQSSESTNLTPNLPPQVSRIITTKRSRVNWALGPAFGGEYFFSKHFSLGAEVALDFLIIGNEDRSVDPGPPPPSTDDSGVVVSTSALLYARAFLF